MRYASKKEEKMGILPVMNPLFNLREICKQSALLEDHLNNPRKRCPDCIRKHFLTIEALYEEAISLDKKFEYDEHLDGKAQMMRGLQGDWLDSKDTKKYHSVCEKISQSLRKTRKEFAPLCFDVRKMASMERVASSYVCLHMKVATDYSDYEESMDALLNKFNRGHDTLYVDWEWEIADYFGSLDGMPPEEPTSIKGLHLLPKGGEPRRYALSLLKAEYFYKSEYIPMVEAIIEGLKMEMVEIKELDSHRKGVNALEWRLDDFEGQLRLLKSSRFATLSQTEKEEREMGKLLKKKPKKKPPRKDLMRKRVKIEDPDLEDFGAGAGGDRDLSMNHKRVASVERVALAFLKKASAERNLKGNKKKQQGKQQEKADRKERSKKVREQLESDDKPYIKSEAGNNITFSTAIKADPKTRERKDAEKILRKQRNKAEAEANKKRGQKSDSSEEGSKSSDEKSVGEPQEVRSDFFSLSVEELSNSDREIYDSDSGEKVKFSDAISSDPSSKQYQQAQRAIANLAGAKEDTEAKEESFQKKLDVAKKKKQRSSLQKELLDNPANFVALTQLGSSTTTSDEFQRAVAEMTLTEGFSSSVDLPKMETLSQREKSERTLAIKRLEDDLGNTNDPEVQESLGGQLEDLKERHIQEDNERNERNLEARKEKVKGLLGKLKPEDFKVDFDENDSPEDKKEAIRSLLEGSSQEGRDRVEKNPSLKFVQDLISSNKDQSERNTSAEDERVSDLMRKDFISKLNSSFKKVTAFGSPVGLSASVRNKIKDIVGLIGDIPDVHMKKVQEGFLMASQELADTFMNQGNFADSATALKEALNEGFDTPLNEANGEELGRIIASLAMQGAVLDDFEYGVPTSDSLVTSVKDSRGGMRTIIKEPQLESLMYSQTLRFRGGEGSDLDRRDRALNHYETKMNEAKTDVEKAKYRASYKGVLASKILEEDDNIPIGTPKIDDFFLEHARQSNHPDAIAIVAELASGNPLANQRVRSMKINYLNGLDHDNFVQSVGGENGDFSGLLEVIDPEYCPDIPLNGESAGKKVPIKECPLPVAPEIRKAVRDTISKMVADLYTVDPSGSMRSQRSKSFGADAEATKEYDSLLKNNKKELLRIMGMQTGAKKEAALTWLFLKLRNDNVQRLNLGELVKGYDEGTRRSEDLFQYRRKELEKVFFKANPNQSPEELKQILEELEKSFEQSASTSFSSFRRASLRNKSDLRVARRIISTKRVVNQFISNNVFILGRYSIDPEGDIPMRRQATSYVDYQQRARQFNIGMRVYPYFGGKPDKSGVVVQIFPAIGMVDVQFPHGVSRYPVEDLVLDTSGDYENLANTPDSVPGGRGVVPVSSGPAKSLITDSSKKRVASLYMNKLMRR